MNIAIAGPGYVGLSNAIVLARQHDVTAVDVCADRVAALNAGRTPVEDTLARAHLASGTLRLRATTDAAAVYADADYVLIATPTHDDPATNAFDTTSIEPVIAQVLAVNARAVMVIKSPVPVGYTKRVRARFGRDRIVFSPEFLCEGRAREDNLHPTRIVVGEVSARGEIVDALCIDPRIGAIRNTPFFGYGGYPLPKDPKQRRAKSDDVPQALIPARLASNDARKRAVADSIAARGAAKVAICRLVMKQGSPYRSVVFSVADRTVS